MPDCVCAPEQADERCEDSNPTSLRVNEYTWGMHSQVDAAVAPEGSSIVVWTFMLDLSLCPQETYLNREILGRRFGPDGKPLGGDFVVGADRESDVGNPVVAAGEDGRFVVAWYDEDIQNADQSFGAVRVRRYAPDGSPIGPVQVVEGFHIGPLDAAVLANGDFLVAGMNVTVVEGESHGRPAVRVFAADGTPSKHPTIFETENGMDHVLVAPLSSDRAVLAGTRGKECVKRCWVSSASPRNRREKDDPGPGREPQGVTAQSGETPPCPPEAQAEATARPGSGSGCPAWKVGRTGRGRRAVTGAG